MTPDAAARHINRFQDLCRIQSPSLSEGLAAAYVRDCLESFGLECREDEAAEHIRGQVGNLICKVQGRIPHLSIIVAAHLDTVPTGTVIEPQLVEGHWTNGGDGILGVDNKAAVSALLSALEVWSDDPPDVSVTAIFTVAEEISLLGANALSAEDLNAEAAFVFDHPTPIGTVVISSPSHHSIEIEFTGAAAHAGVAPEEGASAIAAAATAVSKYPAGRVDPQTTSNFGVIKGGTAPNVVAEKCFVRAEVRSRDSSSLTRETQAIIEASHEGAGLHGCSADIVVRPSFSGYEHSDTHRALLIGERALARIGFEPNRITSAGGSDANVFEQRGVPSLNLGDGSAYTHTDRESITESDLVTLVDLVLALPSAAAVQA